MDPEFMGGTLLALIIAVPIILLLVWSHTKLREEEEELKTCSPERRKEILDEREEHRQRCEEASKRSHDDHIRKFIDNIGK